MKALSGTKNKRSVLSLLLWAVLVTPQLAFAYAYVEEDAYRNFDYLGRANTGVASVSDGNALHYNPAGLAYGDLVEVNLLDPSLASNQNIVSGYSAALTLTSGNESLTQKFAPFLGKPLGVQGSFFPFFSTKGFGIGFYDSLDVEINYRNPVYPQMEINARNDYGLIAGTGVEVFENFSLGISGKYVFRQQIDETLTAAVALNATTAYLNSLIRRGDAFGINLGARYKYKLNEFNSLYFGAAIEDVGVTKFRSDLGEATPTPQDQKMNIGMTYQFTTAVTDVSLFFDMRHLNRPGVSNTKKIFLGGEVDFPLATLAGGFYQGYWTTSVRLGLIPFIDLIVGTYAEELGTGAGISKNRFWYFGIRSSVDISAKGSKKKQRFTLDHL